MEEREVGVRHILRIRREAGENVPAPRKRKRKEKVQKKIRKYRPRPINWNASTVGELVDLSAAETEPPLTLKLSDAEIEQLVYKPLEIPAYECVSQFVERAVKGTTEASSRTTGADRQDAVTMNKAAAREKVPNIKHKKHFRF